MTPERWQIIQRLFHEALERESRAERLAFLAEACGEDEDLLKTLQGMLAGDAGPPAILQASVGTLAADLTEEAAADVMPKRIGPYRLLRRLGDGGMGVVYLAERDDDQYHRRVALKLARSSLRSEDVLLRFRNERQILASLEHPNIARLYDGGIAPQGQPYLAMAYVEGRTIDAYCDAERLSVEARLGLFATVCDAVGYAHRKLVVHRDLKPANILVTDGGDVKLLDFGIAKLLDDQAPGAAYRTRTGLHLMTPAYAAPEQIRGEEVSTATDVFALGVVLFELLTGSRPFAAEGTAPRDAERAVLEGDPTRPSAAVLRPGTGQDAGENAARRTPQEIAARRSTTPRRLQRRLRGDLDRILLKALRQEPERRYRSADAFLEDIRRHLEGLPVRARPDTASYRVGTFVRRHRFGVAAAAAFVLLLAAFAALMALQQRRTAVERDLARQERDKAERVVEVFSDMLQAADPGEARGDTLTVYEALSRSQARIDTALTGQPDVQAALFGVLGGVYRSLGQYDEAHARLERALDVQRRLYADPNPETAQTLTDLARVAEQRGDYEAAEAFHREALAMRHDYAGEGDPETIDDLNGLAALLYRRGDLEGAAARFEELLAVNRQAFSDRHLSTATVLNDLGAVYKQQGTFDRSERLLREAIDIRGEILGEDHPDVLTSQSNLASLLSERGDQAAAERLFRAVLAARLDILGPTHPRIALTRTGLAVALHRKGDHEAAEEQYRAALEINRGALAADHPTVGMDLAVLAGVLLDQARHDEARPLYEEALAIFRSRLPADHPVLAVPLLGLGTIEMEQGAFARALPLLEESVRLRMDGFGPDRWSTAQSQSALGACLTALGRYEEAEPLLTNAYGQLSAELGDADKATRAAGRRLAALYEAWGRPPPTVP